MSSIRFKRLARFGTGVILLLLVQGFYAPRYAWAACSHLVTSRTESGHQFQLVERLILDLNGGRTDSLPLPAPTRPCSGRWCSSEPAAPSVPLGTIEGRLDTWACFVEIPGLNSTSPSRLSDQTTVLRPIQGGSVVFHPPRFLPPA